MTEKDLKLVAAEMAKQVSLGNLSIDEIQKVLWRLADALEAAEKYDLAHQLDEIYDMLDEE